MPSLPSLLSIFDKNQKILKTEITKNGLTLINPEKPEFSKFLKTNVRFEVSTFEVVYLRNFIKIRKLILFDSKYPNLGIWALIWKTRKSKKFQIFPILNYWFVSGCFAIFWGRSWWFWLVSAGFGSFELVPGFSKYNKMYSERAALSMKPKQLPLDEKCFRLTTLSVHSFYKYTILNLS